MRKTNNNKVYKNISFIYRYKNRISQLKAIPSKFIPNAKQKEKVSIFTILLNCICVILLISVNNHSNSNVRRDQDFEQQKSDEHKLWSQKQTTCSKQFPLKWQESHVQK